MNGLEALDSVRCALSLCPNHNYKKENNLCNIIEKELKAFEVIKKKVDERRIVLENNFDNKFSLGGLELCDLTYSELATILEWFDFENIKVVDGEIQILSIRS